MLRGKKPLLKKLGLIGLGKKNVFGVLKTQIKTDDSEIRLINNKVENIFEQ
jgi:hypothetical protein